MNTVTITAPNDADFYRSFLYRVVDEGPPIDLTGATMKMVLRKNAADSVAVMELTTEDGGININPPATDGKFTILIEQEALERLPVGTYDHSLILIQGALKTRIWGGTFTVEAGPSR